MAIETLFEPFVLSPLDHANPDVFVFFYLSFCVHNSERALQDISRGVGNLILRVPFLAGEIAPSTRLSGPQNACEVRPSTATADIPMLQVKYLTSHTLGTNRFYNTDATWRRSSPSPDVSYDPLPSVLPDTQPRPVVRFQANIVSDGVVLTMAFNHFVIDATGAGIILELLSESCRSQSSAELDESPNERAPVQERYFRELILNMACSDSEAYHEDSFNRSFGTPSSSQFRKDLLERMSTPSRNLSEEYITFSAKKIDQLKKACNYVLAWVRETATEMPQVDVPLPSFVSTNNVLTALLWGMIIKARHGSGASSKQNEQQHQDYDCTMAINLRSFFDPPLPVRYMGNTTTALRLTVKSTDLLRNPTVIAKDLDVQVSSRFGVDLYSLLPIAYTSYRIRDHLSRIDDTYVRSLIAFFKSHKDWNTMKFSPADIMITSVRHLKVYELDFGQSLGYIVSFSNQRSLVGNLCLIMPASVPISRAASTEERNDCPPWEVRVTLDETTMDNLKRDSLLRWALES